METAVSKQDLCVLIYLSVMDLGPWIVCGMGSKCSIERTVNGYLPRH